MNIEQPYPPSGRNLAVSVRMCRAIVDDIPSPRSVMRFAREKMKQIAKTFLPLSGAGSRLTEVEGRTCRKASVGGTFKLYASKSRFLTEKESVRGRVILFGDVRISVKSCRTLDLIGRDLR